MPTLSKNQWILFGLVAVSAILLFLVFSSKPKHIEPVSSTLESDKPSSNYLAEAEERRQQAWDEAAEVKRRERVSFEKKNSVECQFWKQQKLTKPTPKVDEKIAQFCELEDTAAKEDTAQK